MRPGAGHQDASRPKNRGRNYAPPRLLMLSFPNGEIRPPAGFHPRHPRNPKPKIGGGAKPETQGPWRGETRNPRSVPRRNPKPSTKFLFADPFTPLTSLFPCRSTYSSDLTLFPFFHPSSSLPPLKQKRKGRPGRPMAPLSLEHALCPATYTPYLPFWTLTAENTSQNL